MVRALQTINKKLCKKFFKTIIDEVMTSTHDGAMQRIDSSCERRIMTRAIAQVCPVRCLVVDRQQTIIRRVRRIIVRVRTTYDPLRTSPRLRPVKVSLAVVMHRHRSTVVFACISSTSHRNKIISAVANDVGLYDFMRLYDCRDHWHWQSILKVL